MKGSTEETRHAYKNLWRIETALFIVFWSFHAPRDYIEPVKSYPAMLVISN